MKALKIDQVEPTVEDQKTYPFTRGLYFYTVEGKLSASGKAFIEWVKTAPQAAKVISRVGFLSVKAD